MSQEGKIRRGEVYYSKRNRDDVLPKQYTANKGIMSDVQAYLDTLPKVKEETKKTSKEK